MQCTAMMPCSLRVSLAAAAAVADSGNVAMRAGRLAVDSIALDGESFLGVVSGLVHLLRAKELFLGVAALPAVTPVANQVVEQPALEVQARSDAHSEVVEVHLVAVLVGEEERQVAGDGEQEVVVEWWELGECVAKLL